MIKSFKSKKLEKAYTDDDFSGINPQHRDRCQLLLSAIDVATSAKELDQPSFRLHELKGDRKGIWAVTVRANWRITFKLDNENAYILDYEDYH